MSEEIQYPKYLEPFLTESDKEQLKTMTKFERRTFYRCIREKYGLLLHKCGQ